MKRRAFLKSVLAACVMTIGLSVLAPFSAPVVRVHGESLIEVLDEGQYQPAMCYDVRAWTSANVLIGEILTPLEQFGYYYNSTTESWQIPNEDMGITPAEALTYHHYTVSAYGQGQC